MRVAIFSAVVLLFSYGCCYCQDTATKISYEKSFADIKEALDLKAAFSFKNICFVTEDTYISGRLDYNKFNNAIQQLKLMALSWMAANPLKNYPYSDSINFHRNLAIFKVLKDTIRLVAPDSAMYAHLPYEYDFQDYSGQIEWSNMFVTKLLATHRGNCHSLPSLYKILADELGATCWLALSPNHMYISNRCKKIGWYNTELTSGSFPIDAWIMASGYLPLQAVQNGIYMDTLSNQQSIAMCVLDLAKGYEHKTHNYNDGFILKCCDLSLQYFPLNVQAILLKAETLKRIYEKEKVQKSVAAKETYHQMEQLYVKLFDLGYREMPDKMYQQWLLTVVKERDKYSNKKLTDAIQNRN
jgi:hypothetical protein